MSGSQKLMKKRDQRVLGLEIAENIWEVIDSRERTVPYADSKARF